MPTCHDGSLFGQVPIMNSSTTLALIGMTLESGNASANTLTIVTKDADFSHRVLLTTSGPNVIHIRVGNLTSQNFTAIS
jgi:predicted nuclease of predicted toxin-antitoxin system